MQFFTTGLTVLITTHYIEEAKEANQVAFIYRGLCLEQNSPQKLLYKYNCSTLEKVSYRLCCNYDDARKHSIKTSQEASNKTFIYFNYYNLKVNKTRIKALSWKLASQMKGITVIFALCIILTASTIHFPIVAFIPLKNIPIALLDADNTNLSRSFVDTLDPNIFRVSLSKRVDSGIESVVRVKNMMFAEIPKGFTDRIKQLESGQFDDQDDFEETDNQMTKYGNIDSSDWLSALLNTYSRNDSIKLYIDTTSPVPTYYSLIHTFIAFQKALDKNQDIFPNLNRQNNFLGIKLEDPIHGSFDVEFKDSVVCGQLIIIILFYSQMFTALVLSLERESGVKHRDSVSGITKMESITTVFIFGFVFTIKDIVTLVVTLLIFYDTLHLNRLYEATLLLLVVNVEGSLIGIICALTIKDKTGIMVRHRYYYRITPHKPACRYKVRLTK